VAHRFDVSLGVNARFDEFEQQLGDDAGLEVKEARPADGAVYTCGSERREVGTPVVGSSCGGNVMLDL
jgi:hypothetical protein